MPVMHTDFTVTLPTPESQRYSAKVQRQYLPMSNKYQWLVTMQQQNGGLASRGFRTSVNLPSDLTDKQVEEKATRLLRAWSNIQDEIDDLEREWRRVIAHAIEDK